jgi:hypothetical protein
MYAQLSSLLLQGLNIKKGQLAQLHLIGEKEHQICIWLMSMVEPLCVKPLENKNFWKKELILLPDVRGKDTP